MPRKVGELLKIIEADGWYLVNTPGEPIGTERSILKQAGLDWRSV